MLAGLPAMCASRRLWAGVMLAYSPRFTAFMISPANQSERAISSCLRFWVTSVRADGPDLVGPSGRC
jgi:hypothetical protein